MNVDAKDSGRWLPHGNCYAVVPGRFLAGEYPARGRLGAIIKYGVTDFVDLTSEEDGLVPYAEAARKIARKLGREAGYKRFPIFDGAVPVTDSLTRTILDHIDGRIDEGGCVYLHCWGGIGRTGTIVGCYLVRHGLDPEEALDRVESCWRSMAKYSSSWTSPENELQKDYVRNWGGKE